MTTVKLAIIETNPFQPFLGASISPRFLSFLGRSGIGSRFFAPAFFDSDSGREPLLEEAGEGSVRIDSKEAAITESFRKEFPALMACG